MSHECGGARNYVGHYHNIIFVFYRSVFLPWMIFHNLRLIHRMKNPAHVEVVEPCIGWNDEDFKVGLTKFGVAEYQAPTKANIKAPKRPPEITFEPELALHFLERNQIAEG